VRHLSEQPFLVDRNVGAAIYPRIVGLRIPRRRQGSRRSRRRTGDLRDQGNRRKQQKREQSARGARQESHAMLNKRSTDEGTVNVTLPVEQGSFACRLLACSL